MLHASRLRSLADVGNRIAVRVRRSPRFVFLLTICICIGLHVQPRVKHWTRQRAIQERRRQQAITPTLPPPRLLEATAPGNWSLLLRALEDPTFPRVVIIDGRNGLANRLRAIASAMGVASSLQVPLLVLWEVNAHVNCSMGKLFQKEKLPFALFEHAPPGYEKQILARAVTGKVACARNKQTGQDVCAEVCGTGLVCNRSSFVAYNYMEAEGGKKDRRIKLSGKPLLHMYFRSAFMLAHKFG